MSAEAAIQALEQSIAGLLYMSECDDEQPFEPVHWPGEERVDEKTLRKQVGIARDVAIETQHPDAFFKGLTKEPANHDDIEADKARKFRDLQSKLRQHLSDVNVFRVKRGPTDDDDDTNVDIFIIGMTPTGHIVGLKTRAEET